MGEIDESSYPLVKPLSIMNHRYVLALGLSFLTLQAAAQDDSPYAKFGYEGRVLHTPQERQQYMLLVPNTDTTATVASIGIDPQKGKYYLFDKNQHILGTDTLRPEQLSRFLSEDPLTKKYPELTPYQFASNTPIMAIDLDGLEAYAVYNKATNTTIIIPNESTIKKGLALKTVSAFEYNTANAYYGNQYNYAIKVQGVFTGGHYNKEQGAVVYNDPSRPKEKSISVGTYNLLENKGNTNPAHDRFFVLDPQDESPYDKVDDRPGEINSLGKQRDGYNFHPGNVSWGCVTVGSNIGDSNPEMRAAEWDVIYNAITNTQIESVPDNRGKHRYIPFDTQIKFGELKVIDTSPTGTPPPAQQSDKRNGAQ